MNVLTNTPLTMSSREIAELVDKEHSNVMRDIRTMMEALSTDSDLNPCAKSTNYTGKDGRQYNQYELDKDTCLTLILGYDPVKRMKVVKRWQQLEQQAPKTPAALSRMEVLQLAMEAEQARIKAEAEAERDEAIRTKALIGSRREATAMATASAAKREIQRLTEELGRNMHHATIVAVERATGRKFGWPPLRKFCEEHGLSAAKVADPRWGEVKAWPAEAWSAVYDIHISEIFAVRAMASSVARSVASIGGAA